MAAVMGSEDTRAANSGFSFKRSAVSFFRSRRIRLTGSRSGMSTDTRATSTRAARRAFLNASGIYFTVACSSSSFAASSFRSLVQGLRRVSALSRQRTLPPSCMTSSALSRCRAPSEKGGFMTIAAYFVVGRKVRKLSCTTRKPSFFSTARKSLESSMQSSSALRAFPLSYWSTSPVL